MSIKVMSWVWDSSEAAGIDRLVLLAIADAASHDDGTNAYPSIATLSRKAKVSPRTVQRSIRALCDLGELKMELNAGRKGVNMYRVVMRQADTSVSESPRTDDTRQADVSPVTESPTPVNESRNPRPDDTRTVLDPSLTEREPSSNCSNHPSGTDKPCRACGTARQRYARWSKAEPARREQARLRKAHCPRCNGDGWLTDEDGKPVARCNHEMEAAS